MSAAFVGAATAGALAFSARASIEDPASFPNDGREPSVANARLERPLPTYGATEGGPPVLLTNGDGQSPFAGVVRLQSRATCTGVLLATDPDRPDEAPAYVLTNAHCVDFPGSNDVLHNLPARGHVVFDYFVDTVARQQTVRIAGVPYATMKGIDFAVVELVARYGELVGDGFTPIPIARRPPTTGEPVVVVGAPLQQMSSAAYLRLAACRVDGRAPLVLEHVWHWFSFDRNGCAGIQAGSSGSPVLSRGSGAIVGLINTTTANSRPVTACTIDSPCEPTDGGSRLLEQTNYSSPVVGLDRCFDENGRFERARPGCPLDPGGILAFPGTRGGVNPTLTTAIVGPPQRAWNVRVDQTWPYYRYKVVDALADDCRDLRGYSRPSVTEIQPTIGAPYPFEEGVHLLCVLGGATRDWSRAWQHPDFPTVIPVRIDRTPPRLPAQADIVESANGWQLMFRSVAPEIAWHTFKFGRVSDVRCDDPADYRLALVPFVLIPRTGSPIQLCIVPYDDAENAGQVLDRVLM